MRHGVAFSKLNRDKVHRAALFKNLATALIKHERIVTTLAKGKQMRRIGDRVCDSYIIVSMILSSVIEIVL